MVTDRLYTIVGGERAYPDIGALYEAEIDPYVDPDDDDTTGEYTVEQWTVTGPEVDCPSMRDILEWVCERATDDCPEVYEHWERALAAPAVQDAFRGALDTLLRHVDYRTCDRRVCEHTISFTDLAVPLVDGEPLYVTRTEST